MRKQKVLPARSMATKHTLKRFKTEMTSDMIPSIPLMNMVISTSRNGAVPFIIPKTPHVF